jgi:uncharacterized membrane protein YfcA
MGYTNQVASTQTTNIVPVQAAFNSAGVCTGLIGPGGAVFLPPLSPSVIGGKTTITAATGTKTVTNANVTTASVVVATVATLDDTLTSVRVVVGNGSFTITGNTDATATTTINYIIVN